MGDQLRKQALPGWGKGCRCPGKRGCGEPDRAEGLWMARGSHRAAGERGSAWLVGLGGCRNRVWLRQDALSGQLGKVIQLAGLGVRLQLAVGQFLILEQSNAESFEWHYFLVI